MVKQGVVPDDLTRPFFEAANEGRLVVQARKGSDRLYFPPKPASELGCSPEDLEWREVSGRGKIYNYCVVYDCPVATLKEGPPFQPGSYHAGRGSGIVDVFASAGNRAG